MFLSCCLKDGKEFNAVILVGRLFHTRATVKRNDRYLMLPRTLLYYIIPSVGIRKIKHFSGANIYIFNALSVYYSSSPLYFEQDISNATLYCIWQTWNSQTKTHQANRNW